MRSRQTTQPGGFAIGCSDKSLLQQFLTLIRSLHCNKRGDMPAAAEYKTRAKECRRLAQEAPVPEDKRALEELAHNWEILAKLGDRKLVSENRTSPILDLIDYKNF